MKIAGLAAEGRDHPVLRRGRFQQPQRGGADADDPAAGGPRRVQPRRAVAAEISPHSACMRWSADVIDLDRQEGAGPDVQRHRHAPDARASSRASRSGVKCRPAVGAATAPSRAAKTVW